VEKLLMPTFDVAPGEKHNPLQDSKILLVEDNAFVSLDLDVELRKMGCAAVLSVGSINAACSVLATERPDLALLDVMVGRKLVTPVAARLAADGIPYAIVTGYSPDVLDYEPLLRDVPYLSKPFDSAHFTSFMLQMTSRSSSASVRSTSPTV
jgi:CheY-like chemotaxis protein